MTDAVDFKAVASDILTSAALVHRFDPLDLMPEAIDPAIEAKALATVARDASEVEWEDPKNPERRLTLWRLNPPARRSQLARIVAEGRLQEALRRSSPMRDDVFARYLQAALVGKLKPDSVPAEDRDTAAVAADFAAEALGKDDLASTVRQAAVSLRSLVSQQTEQRRSSSVLPGKLIGRAVEQAIIDNFVKSGVVPESDRLPQPAKPAIQVRPFLLTGAPGAGKSALVADLVRRLRGYSIDEPSFEWGAGLRDPIGALMSAASAAKAATAAVVSAATGLFQTTEPAANQPVVLLDFDRPGIALGGEFEWMADTTRQLGYGRPELSARLSEMRARARQDQAKFDPSGRSMTAILTATSDMKTGLASELGAAGLAGGVLVVVLDTFEEVIVRSPIATDEQIPGSLLGRVLMWADSLATLKSGDAPTFGAVRVFASGREKPDLDQNRLAQWFVAHRVVGDLDVDAAIEFLRQRDGKRRFGAKLARAAVEKLGGHPLTLILLEAYARNLPLAEIRKTIADGNIGRILGSENATRTLYSRFLQRFHHDLELHDGVTAAMVQAVAHPGLMLREITPEILREVICPACGLEPISPETAQALFDRLRTQIWLVENVEGRTAIRHRSDVRRLMLPMMAGDLDGVASSPDLREKMMNVHRRAAVWYDKTSATDPRARLEALYHRAFLPDDSFQRSIASMSEGEVAQLLRRVAESAGDDLSVMPIANRAPLRFYSAGAGRMTEAEIKALPDAQRKTAEVELLEQRRQRGAAGPPATSPIATAETPIAASLESAAIGETPQGGSDAPPAAPPTGTVDPSRLLELINDRELSARVGSAFTAGDFITAAATGWRAIAGLPAFPDLTERLRFSEDATTHWFWQSAMAGLALPDEVAPSREMLEQYLRRFCDSVDVRRCDINSAGLIFAGATTIALDGRLSAASTEATSRLAEVVQRLHSITTHSDLRLLALHPLWRHNAWQPPEVEVRFPFNRIQLFSPDLLSSGANFRRILEPLLEFVSRARDGKVSSKEVDAFASSSDQSVYFTGNVVNSKFPAGRLLTGVTPEIYDSAVRALIGSDNLSYGSVDRAIRLVMGQAPFWPYDLVPGEISSRDADLRAGLLARVVVHADRCGLLVPLFEEAKKVNASVHLRQLAQLFRRYEDVRNLGYRAEPSA